MRLIGGHDVVEGIGDFPNDSIMMTWNANREVARSHGLERIEKPVKVAVCPTISARCRRVRACGGRVFRLASLPKWVSCMSLSLPAGAPHAALKAWKTQLPGFEKVPLG